MYLFHGIILKRRKSRNSSLFKITYFAVKRGYCAIIIMSSKYVIRRVRLDLPSEVTVSPFKEQLENLPYAEWLRNHVKEVSALVSIDDQQLLVGICSRSGTSAGGRSAVFVTDFCFGSKEHFDYYNATFLPTMRNRITESYPGALSVDGFSPFKYSFAIKGEGDASAYEELGAIDDAVIIAFSGITDF